MYHQIVMHDMRYSLNQVEKASPIIKQLLGGGEIKPVEGNDNDICLMLDQNCGIDYFQTYGKDHNLNGITWGVGSRFQKIPSGCKPYNTFTVRKERESGARTEYQKRCLAIKYNGIYPYLTMHGYYDSDTGEILSLAIAKTENIFDVIDQGYYRILRTGFDQFGQAYFYAIDWETVKRLGYPVKIYKKE